ncbi:hypothetical protein GLOIN_2v1533887 [Rhizophagus clarus]|uniref:Uncharacterized protein n=1 Tax=Rhizophagus clarus TaxID=94130 RepID=A0A8H3M0B7_9GLOM|nr:hypothetical protein GLOIN_2v1533887 [Rhizophagus clarus]
MGINDHGTLGHFTEILKSTEAKNLFESGNYNIIEEGIPAYAEGLDDVNIVKVGKDGVIGFSYDNRIEQPIFTRYSIFENLKIVDTAAGVDHALALTTEGELYV